MTGRGLAAAVAILGFGAIGYLIGLVAWGAIGAHSWVIAAVFGLLFYLVCVLCYKFVTNLYRR